MKVFYSTEAQKQLGKLDRQIQSRIKNYMDGVSSLADPRSRGKGLTADKSGFWRYRVGDYRIICLILDDRLVISVVKIGHRRDVY